MDERIELTSEEHQLEFLIKQSEDAGSHAKELLLKLLEDKDAELPEIKVYDPEAGFYQTKTVKALPIDLGALGKEFAWYWERIPEPTPLIAMTNEGIYRVPVHKSRVSTNYSVWAADWGEKTEIEPIEYLMLIPKVLHAIREESGELVSVS